MPVRYGAWPGLPKLTANVDRENEMPAILRSSALLIGLVMVAVPTRGQLLVASTADDNRIVIHAAGARGDAAPLAVLSGQAIAEGSPVDLVVDPVHGELLVGQNLDPAVTVFALDATGEAPTLRTLQGPATGFDRPSRVALDLVHDELWVADGHSYRADGTISVFPRAASGNVAPLRKIKGSGVVSPSGIAFDPVAGEVWVTDWYPGSIKVFDRLAQGNAAPKRVISGPATSLDYPRGIVYDPVRQEIVVTDDAGAVLTFPRAAKGNVAPRRRIAGGKTRLHPGEEVMDLELLGDSEIAVAYPGRGGFDHTDDAVLVFSRDAHGDVAPRRRLEGAAARIEQPYGVALARRALLLGGGRFAVEAVWRTADGGVGVSQPHALTADTGYLWFFGPSNVETVVKVLDGCAVNDRFWVFAAGLTDTDVELRVTDLATGLVRGYHNAQGRPFAPIQDTAAFASCGATFQASSPEPVATARAERPDAVAGSACSGLCLNGGRFEVTAHWSVPGGGGGAAHGVALTADTGYQWFFAPDNVETVVKVLDGCAVNSRYWVFAAGLTDVAVTLTVRDTLTAETRSYTSPAGEAFAPIQDTGAFAGCP